MKFIILVIALESLVITGRTESTDTILLENVQDYKSYNYYENESNILCSSDANFTCSCDVSSINTKLILSSDTEMTYFNYGDNSSLEIHLTTRNGTMIPAIPLVLSTISDSSLVLTVEVETDSSSATEDSGRNVVVEILLLSPGMFFVNDTRDSNVESVLIQAEPGYSITEVFVRNIAFTPYIATILEFGSTPKTLESTTSSSKGETSPAVTSKSVSSTPKQTFTTNFFYNSSSTSSIPNVTTGGLSTSTRHTNTVSSVPSVTTRHTYTTTSPSPSASYCSREYSCVNCMTARICAPTPGGQGLWEVSEFSCPDHFPWCDSRSGTCSAVRGPECNLPVVGNFTCMRDGHFPDPDSCADYYVCDNDVPLEFTCLNPTPYYSPLSQSCGNSSSVCMDYQSMCDAKSGLKVPVPLVHDLFLYCVDGAVEVVDRCVGAYQFDFERQVCVPECPHAGLFPRDDDCAGYYRCSPSSSVGNNYEMTNLTCPLGMGFSESAYDCVDRSLAPNCNALYIN